MTTTKIKIKTAVVILNWNGKKLLEQFIPSVISHTVSDDCSVVIADNGSTDDSVAFMKAEYPDVPLIVLDRPSTVKTSLPISRSGLKSM